MAAQDEPEGQAATAESEPEPEPPQDMLGKLMTGMSTLFSPRGPTPNATAPAELAKGESTTSPKYNERVSRAKATNQARLSARPSIFNRSFKSLFGFDKEKEEEVEGAPAPAEGAPAPAEGAPAPRKRSSIMETVAAMLSEMTPCAGPRTTKKAEPKLRNNTRKFSALPAGLPPGA